MLTITIIEFVNEHGVSLFNQWFKKLDHQAAAKIATALYRIELGNFSNTKSLGKGIYEYKINFGPGYRIYFGQDGDRLVILLGGGTKKQQQKDIMVAASRWEKYKLRKKEKLRN